jgi:hypothetical protein
LWTGEEVFEDGHTAGAASDQSGLAFEGEELLYGSHDLCVRDSMSTKERRVVAEDD